MNSTRRGDFVCHPLKQLAIFFIKGSAQSFMAKRIWSTAVCNAAGQMGPSAKYASGML